MIVRTHLYRESEIGQIVTIRAKTEGLDMSEDAIKRISEIGSRTSLRYVMQLLTPASINADMAGRSRIEEEDINEMYDIFLDTKRSSEALQNADGKYLK